MQDAITVTGMILSQTPIGEYDRRICILTKERGKISAFAKGARRSGSRFMAATNPFCFGEFRLYEGKSSYNLMEVNISNYFEQLRTDYIGAYYGMYFLEVADYYTRENNDEKEMLKLLYQSFRALVHPTIPNSLARAIFEIKAVAVNGEFPGVPKRGVGNSMNGAVKSTGETTAAGASWDESTVYAVEYIAASTVEKLYTFSVTETVLSELLEIGEWCRKRFFNKEFKSLEILETLE